MREGFYFQIEDRHGGGWPERSLLREELRKGGREGWPLSAIHSAMVPTHSYLPHSPYFLGTEASVEVLTVRHPSILELLITVSF